MRRRRHFLLRALIGLVLATLPPAPAAAHQQLIGSSPQPGAILGAAPAELRLRFNEPVDPELARLSLLGPSGEVALGSLQVAEDDAAVLLAAITGPLRAGEYTISWLVTGRDGHPVRGEIRFAVAEGATGLAPDEPAPASAAGDVAGAGAADPEPAPSGGVVPPAGDALRFSSGSPLYVAVRWLTFVGVLMVVGAVSFALLLVPGVERRGGPAALGAELAEATRRAAGLGLGAAVAVVAAAALRLLAQGIVLGEGLAGGSEGILWTMLRSTSWGWGWILQVGAALVLVAAFLAVRRGRRRAWGVAAPAAIVLAATPALSGHAAAASPAAVAADALHVIAAGGWLGTLLMMIVAAAPLLLATSDGRGRNAAALLGAFSPLALAFAALLTLTGVYAAWLHLPGPGALVNSDYGLTLLAKLALLLLVFVAGAYNWLRARPTVEGGGDTRPLRNSATAELALGALVLAVTAALVATPPPSDEAAAAAASEPGLEQPLAGGDG